MYDGNKGPIWYTLQNVDTPNQHLALFDRTEYILVEGFGQFRLHLNSRLCEVSTLNFCEDFLP